MSAFQPDRLDFDHKNSDSYGDGEVQCKTHHTLWLVCAKQVSTNLASLCTLINCIRIAIGVEGLHSRGKDWVQVQYSRITLCIVNGVSLPEYRVEQAGASGGGAPPADDADAAGPAMVYAPVRGRDRRVTGWAVSLGFRTWMLCVRVRMCVCACLCVLLEF